MKHIKSSFSLTKMALDAVSKAPTSRVISNRPIQLEKVNTIGKNSTSQQTSLLTNYQLSTSHSSKSLESNARAFHTQSNLQKETNGSTDLRTLKASKTEEKSPLLTQIEAQKFEAVLVDKEKTGVGVTKSGIPIERIDSTILQQIEPDEQAAYGYSAKKGTAYEALDFRDVEKAKEGRATRLAYLAASEKLDQDLACMEAEGKSKEEMAKYAVETRNAEKVAARTKMDSKDREVLEKRNIEKYGNPIGPTADQLFQDIKKKQIKAGMYKSDEQIWDELMKKSTKKDEVINTLLGIESKKTKSQNMFDQQTRKFSTISYQGQVPIAASALTLSKYNSPTMAQNQSLFSNVKAFHTAMKQPNLQKVKDGSSYILPSLNQLEQMKKEGIRSLSDKVEQQQVRSVSGQKEKTGIGVTKAGIPIERVDSKVLQQIEPDEKAAYGYSAKKGTAYESLDFRDIEKAKKGRETRLAYLAASEKLNQDLTKMKAEGKSKEEMAKYAVETRNAEKVAARAQMTSKDREVLEKRNIEKYGNPIGPTTDQLFQDIKKKQIKAGTYTSDEQIWDELMEKSTKKDEVINTLLGIETKKNNQTVTYRRVQGGGEHGKTLISQERVQVNPDGTLSVSKKDRNLNISIDDGEHATYFKSKRGEGAEIIEFEVPKWFDDFLQDNAIPQQGYKKNPKNQEGSAPKIVDPAKPGKSMEVPPPWPEWIEDVATKGRKKK